MNENVSLEKYVNLKIQYAELKEKYLKLKNSVRLNSILYNIQNFKTKYEEGFNQMELEKVSDEIPHNKKKLFNEKISSSGGNIINNSLIVERDVVITTVLNIIKDIEY